MLLSRANEADGVDNDDTARPAHEEADGVDNDDTDDAHLKLVLAHIW